MASRACCGGWPRCQAAADAGLLGDQVGRRPAADDRDHHGDGQRGPGRTDAAIRPKPLVGIGLLISAGAMARLTGIGVHSGYVSALLGPVMLVGVGMGLVYAAGFNTGTAGVAMRDAGVASASVGTGQQLGGAIGTALLNTIAASATARYLTSNLHARPTPNLLQLAAVHGYITVFWWCAGIFAGGVVICGGLLLRPGRLPSPEAFPGTEQTSREATAVS